MFPDAVVWWGSMGLGFTCPSACIWLVQAGLESLRKASFMLLRSSWILLHMASLFHTVSHPRASLVAAKLQLPS